MFDLKSILEERRKEGIKELFEKFGLDKSTVILYVNLVKYCLERGSEIVREDEVKAMLEKHNIPEKSLQKLIEERLAYRVVGKRGAFYVVTILSDLLAVPRIYPYDVTAFFTETVKLVENYPKIF